MNEIIHLIQTHQAIAGAAGLWIFSAIVGGMPDPDSTSGKGYRWLYGTLHSLAANFKNVGGAIKPPLA